MKKGIVVIVAIAIIGVLGMLSKGNDNNTNHSLVSNGSNASTASTQTANNSQSSSGTTPTSTAYKDGTFTGAAEDTPYGTVQIAVVIGGGKITNVKFLQMPYQEGHSREVTAAAEPLLKQTTLQKQSANIDFVSGATTSSEGYAQSLQAALNQAV